MGKTRKLFAVGSLALSFIIGLSSCQTTKVVPPEEEPKKEEPKKTTPTKKRPATNQENTEKPPETDPTAGTTPEGEETTGGGGTASEDPKTETPPKTGGVEEDYQFGTPVPGRPGMIKSPHAPTAGLIDARGLKPGTKIRCPFSSKVIKVP